ncbi:MAG TPA: hypothetical protein VJ935_08865 [Acidimicrobiia bacterium]|nr:hypothetical protein [Acidimicrobiia bacterium]
MGRTTINTPHDLQLFREIKKGKPYREQIRPGGFLTLAHPHPIEQRELLLAPFTPDPEEALNGDDWVDRASKEAGLSIRTDKPESAIDGSAAVLDYRHYAQQYVAHRDWKTDSRASGMSRLRAMHARVLVRLAKESLQAQSPFRPTRRLTGTVPFTTPMRELRLRPCRSAAKMVLKFVPFTVQTPSSVVVRVTTRVLAQ